jgi:hypothetical protein
VGVSGDDIPILCAGAPPPATPAQGTALPGTTGAGGNEPHTLTGLGPRSELRRPWKQDGGKMGTQLRYCEYYTLLCVTLNYCTRWYFVVCVLGG